MKQILRKIPLEGVLIKSSGAKMQEIPLAKSHPAAVGLAWHSGMASTALCFPLPRAHALRVRSQTPAHTAAHPRHR